MSVHPGIKKKREERKKRESHGKPFETVNEQVPFTIQLKPPAKKKSSVPSPSGIGTLEILFNFISHLSKSAY